jgi:EAL and modified HD-GYP domain-containing signal transduction protein
MQKSDVLLARQPIYDADKEIHAYELLFRDSDQNQANVVCDLSATSNLLLNLFTESDLEYVTGGAPAFVNFSGELLMERPIFEPKSIVIEILENVEITPVFIERVAELKRQGYTLALDDVITAPDYKPLLPYIDIVKIEILGQSIDDIRNNVEYLKSYDVRLLAEKVETHEQFRMCKEMGFELFQGYFLATPELITGKKLATNQIAVLSLVAELQDPNTDVAKVGGIISQDPVISYKLLRLINSAAYRRSKEIDSINSAVALLGLNRVRSLASLMALSKLDNKPDALQYVAIVRAMTCEKLAQLLNADLPTEFYTSGLLSSLDAFFDTPIEQIVEQLPLTDTVRATLVDRSGEQGLVLSTTLLFEQGRVDEIEWDKLTDLGLNSQVINDTYYECSALAMQAESF